MRTGVGGLSGTREQPPHDEGPMAGRAVRRGPSLDDLKAVFPIEGQRPIVSFQHLQCDARHAGMCRKNSMEQIDSHTLFRTRFCRRAGGRA